MRKYIEHTKKRCDKKEKLPESLSVADISENLLQMAVRLAIYVGNFIKVFMKDRDSGHYIIPDQEDEDYKVL